ncbi:hypothetical protein L198_06163 [Cryptococcus wingfieldii CBS 7118]|uniref:Uncharacterized protein n=1 Tax=Cryptococcus wingfieldii CBS 7118 TaxID=1295528 RepID=A0A1E3INY7_9TREE|nr:hypothetical protein L198_06163 [Cryptococcus wingfieldii CBS 7118]ODN90145.1 hypothetical protein L198_06163 [Cryptococcus wingfieldii CBS 7118]
MDQNHEAPTLWAYLYVNWLAPDRWVLWARSSFEDCMPLLPKAFLKSGNFLGKSRARLDEVGHVLNTSVVPQYLQKVTRVGLQLGGRPRVSDLASWRRDLQTMLLAYGRMDIRPCNDVWKQNPASGTSHDSVTPPFWKSPSLPQPSQDLPPPPSSSSTTAYESEDEEELLEQLEDGWMDGVSLSDTDTRRAGAQATQGAAGALGVAEAGTSVLDSITEAERMRREAGEVGNEMVREVETLLKRMRIQVAQKDYRHVKELGETIGAMARKWNADMAKQERAVTSNTRDTNTQRKKRRGTGQWIFKFYDAMKAVASMKNGEPGSSADVN